MDSLLVEALVETREALATVVNVPEADNLRLRRELLERAASTVDLATAPPSHVARVALLVLELRDRANQLRGSHAAVMEVLREAMD